MISMHVKARAPGPYSRLDVVHRVNECVIVRGTLGWHASGQVHAEEAASNEFNLGGGGWIHPLALLS